MIAMIENYFKRAFARRRMAVSHLSIIIEGYVSDLHARGHTANTIQFYVQAVEHFGRWLQRRGVKVHAIRQDHVRRFLFQHLPHCRCQIAAVRTLRICRAAIGRLIDSLQRRGVLCPPKTGSAQLSAADELLRAFDRHLDQICGLSASSRRARQRYIRQFLAWRFGKERLSLRALKAKDLPGFVNRCAQTWTPSGIHDLTVGLRSFLRFLEFSGRDPTGLWRAVPRPAPIPSNQPPTFLVREQMNRFLKCFDRKTPSGRRDLAIALCLSELGLRAAEVAGLTIDDMDWRAMTMRLRRTKQNRERLLPMPSKVAQAVVTYLKKGRPPTKTRALFVRHRAPLGEGLKTHHVRSVVRIAFARCGISYTGTHILRHSWATNAHRRGTSLKLIADILGHRSLNTTSRYAHVNLEELRQAALPWPQSGKNV